MKSLIALTMLLSSAIAACGTASEGAKSAPQQTPLTAQAPAGAEASASAQVAKPATQQTVTPTSYYLDSAADLPTCDAAAEGWLVYLKDPGEFQACEADMWTTVDIQGPAGASGAAGAVGAAGPSGMKGSDGIDAAPGLHMPWIDPDNPSHTWEFVSLGLDFQETQQACAGLGMNLPLGTPPAKLLEYFEALIATLPSNANYWIRNSLYIGGEGTAAWIVQGNNPGAFDEVIESSQTIGLCYK